MKDIQGAYLAEKEYIENGGNLLEILKDYGYDNLREYFDDKNNYLLKQYNFKNNYLTNDEDLLNRIKQSFLNKECGFWTLNSTYTFACIGSDPIDFDLADQLGVRIFDIGYGGGTIISSPNDTACLFMYQKVATVNTDFLFNKLINFLNTKSDKFIIDKNDIMFDGKKVAGVSELLNGDFAIFCLVTSFTDNSELIDKLCPIHIKQPGYIPAEILTKYELEKEIASWANLEI